MHTNSTRHERGRTVLVLNKRHVLDMLHGKNLFAQLCRLFKTLGFGGGFHVALEAPHERCFFAFEQKPYATYLAAIVGFGYLAGADTRAQSNVAVKTSLRLLPRFYLLLGRHALTVAVRKNFANDAQRFL